MDSSEPNGEKSVINTATTDDEVSILFWNVEKGIHLDAACAWIADEAPDVVLWQEMQEADLLRVEERLWMRGFTAAKKSTSGNDNVVLVSHESPFAVVEEHLHPWAPWHAPANIVVRMRDGEHLSPRKLALVSEHSCYWSAAKRLEEADWYSTLAKGDWLTLVAGDWNSYREGEAPDLTDVPDRAFYANRTWMADDGTRRSDDRPHRALTAAGYIEAAQWAAEQLGQYEALSPTAGYGERKARQGGPSAIDRGYLVKELAPAIKRVQIGDPEQFADKSDHAPGLIVFHRSVLAAVMNNEPAAHLPHTKELELHG